MNTLQWNVEKVKSKDFKWFEAVVDGYVKAGKIEKPTEAQVRKTYEKLTGKNITKNE